MRKIAIIIGTRPEAIKLIPVYLEMKAKGRLDVSIISTGQHKEMVQQVFDLFEVKPEIELDIMTPNQTINGLLSKLLASLEKTFNSIKFDGVIVQGDTTSSMGAAIAAFHKGIHVFHVEAGLRSYDLQHPFPEEANRKTIGVYSDLNFTPTETASEALEKEGFDPKKTKQVGNTVIDALLKINNSIGSKSEQYWKEFKELDPNRDFVLITCHRRESFGDGLANICAAISKLSTDYPDTDFVYPVHLNPNVKEVVLDKLGSLPNVKLLAPVPYDQMIFLMSNSLFVLTDSGGIQEEAPSLNKAVLVMRQTTERMEGVHAGCSILVGNEEQKIIDHVKRLIDYKEIRDKMGNIDNPYGDGESSQKIESAIHNFYQD